jgi:hypothetical protein
MSSKAVFTKKDVVVIVFCGVFLLATVGSVGVSGRRRAKEAVCLSNLRQWGTVFLAFAADNDGYFMEGWTGESVAGPPHTRYWMEALRPYYGNNYNLRCCPEAVVPGTDLGQGQYGGAGTFTAWGVFSGECGEPSSGWSWVVACDYGSYGNNAWICNPPPGHSVWWPYQQDFHWRIANVAGADSIPLFGGHQWLDCWPNPYDEPPNYDGEPWMNGSQMGRVCVNRHNGFVNWVFLDASARKVPLKCLWKLNWHRAFDPDRGPTEEEFNSAGDGWMAEFPPCE